MGEITHEQRIAQLLIQNTMRGYRFYQILSSHSKHKQLKKIFSELSRDSHDLSQRFKSWSDLNKHIQPRRPLHFDRSRNFYDRLIDEALQIVSPFDDREALLPEIADSYGAIQIAISFEKDNILFWEQIKAISQGELFELIARLISEKRQRVSNLLKMRGELN